MQFGESLQIEFFIINIAAPNFAVLFSKQQLAETEQQEPDYISIAPAYT